MFNTSKAADDQIPPLVIDSIPNMKSNRTVTAKGTIHKADILKKCVIN